MKMLVVVVFATLVACSPGLAEKRANSGANSVSAARTAAMRECSARAQRYTEYTWGNMEFQQYRACMAEHGHVE